MSESYVEKLRMEMSLDASTAETRLMTPGTSAPAPILISNARHNAPDTSNCLPSHEAMKSAASRAGATSVSPDRSSRMRARTRSSWFRRLSV